MPDKLQEFVRESIDKFHKSLPPEKRLEGLPAEEVIKTLPKYHKAFWPVSSSPTVPPRKRSENRAVGRLAEWRRQPKRQRLGYNGNADSKSNRSRDERTATVAPAVRIVLDGLLPRHHHRRGNRTGFVALKQLEFLDLVLLRKGLEPFPRPLPDGFEDLAAHNLITFKSHQEALDWWALCELIGHFVNYRKQYSPSLKNLLPETDFRLFAVCARFPDNLARQVPMTRLQEGVYEELRAY